MLKLGNMFYKFFADWASYLKDFTIWDANGLGYNLEINILLIKKERGLNTAHVSTYISPKVNNTLFCNLK
jgi:hypothetical protein